MNLDNYHARPIHLLISKEFGTEKKHIMLISDDFTAINKAADAYNNIATTCRLKRFYYVLSAMAFYK